MKSQKSFLCDYCKQPVPTQGVLGTYHRNQCPTCLWSKHVDLKVPGDRKSSCLGLMKPIGLTFKQEGVDKYGKPRQGELMIIHCCTICNQVSINRIAGDDDPKMVLEVFEKSLELPSEAKNELKEKGITLLEEKDREEIRVQLFGRK